MQTVFLPEKVDRACLSKLTCRKHTHIVQICDWAEEKRCRSDIFCRKTESTLSLCARIFFTVSLLLFIVCAIDPSIIAPVSEFRPPSIENKDNVRLHTQRRALENVASAVQQFGKALHGLGTVYRNGARAMNELIVAHISETTPVESFRLFLRTLHRSGATARADVVLLFPWSPPEEMVTVIQEENEFFQKLIAARVGAISREPSATNSPIHRISNATLCPFNFDSFRKAADETDKEAWSLWGSRNGSIFSSSMTTRVKYFSPVVWGSIVGFEASELNPEDELQAFIDEPPLHLRRWACYQLLLGMLRRKFKHVLLIGVEGTLVLRDALAVARRKGAGLYVALEDRTWASAPEEVGEGLCERVYGAEAWRNLDAEERRKRVVSSGAVAAGMHQAHALATAMAVEIVKVAVMRQNRRPFPDNVVLSYLIHKRLWRRRRPPLAGDHLYILHHVDNSFLHSVTASHQPHVFFRPPHRRAYAVLHSSDAPSHLRRQFAALVFTPVLRDICSSPADSAIYSDCSSRNDSSLPT